MIPVVVIVTSIVVMRASIVSNAIVTISTISVTRLVLISKVIIGVGIGLVVVTISCMVVRCLGAFPLRGAYFGINAMPRSVWSMSS